MPAHSCSKRPDLGKPLVQWVQDGYVTRYSHFTGVGERIPRMVRIKTEWLDIPCQYTRRATDPDCAHCERASK